MSYSQESDNLPTLGEILKESLQEGKTPTLTVISDSMAPLLKRGDQVGLQAIDKSQIISGQIITFAYHHQPGEMITHRVVGFTKINGKSKIITLADRSLMFDLPIDIDNVIGHVIWRKRNNRRILLNSGRGLWLSNMLSKLATTELMRITRFNINDDELNLEAIAQSESLRKKGKKINRLRIYRRFNSLSANILTLLVDIFP